MKRIILFLPIVITLMGCPKPKPDSGNTGGGGNNGGGNNGGGNNGGGTQNMTCIVSTISQLNNSTGTESSLTAFYNSNYDVTKLVIYDSVNNIKNFEAVFNYITPDSARLDNYQYFKFDSQKRVIVFDTKSDLKDPANADDYVFKYNYNDNGYLETKNLYINGSPLPNLTTSYTYSNNLIVKCVMTAVSSGNLKVLESELTYDNTITIKNWIYAFPDAIEGYMYLTALNFGNHPVNPLKQVITKIYDPPSGKLIDTWITNYSGYKVDSNGYLSSGIASGDYQEGIGCFYGKTNFYYECH